MNTYIIDFDYTVFDTNAMRAALQVGLQAVCGTSVEEYQAAEKRSTAHGVLYSVEAHLMALYPEHDDRDKARAVIEDALRQMPSWIYPDVLPALQQLRVSGNRLIMLSFGDHDWQMTKVQHSGIRELFDAIEIVQGSKTEPVHLFEATEQGDSICVNDRATEIDELYGVFPHVDYLWIAREQSPYATVAPTAPYQKISSFSDIIATLPA